MHTTATAILLFGALLASLAGARPDPVGSETPDDNSLIQLFHDAHGSSSAPTLSPGKKMLQRQHRYGTDSAVAAGGTHSHLLTPSGTAYAFGSWHESGVGTVGDKNTPVLVGSLTDLQAVAGGTGHTLFLTQGGAAYAAGANQGGQLGDGTKAASWLPVLVAGVTDLQAVTGGSSHSLVLTQGGAAYGFGTNLYGQLGVGFNFDPISPTLVASLTNLQAVAAGGAYSLFLTQGGRAYAAGSNARGEFGDGTKTDRNTPVLVGSVTGLQAINAGFRHSLFLTQGGAAYASGENFYGELGDATNTDKTTPVLVGVTGLQAFAGGNYFTLLLTQGGAAYACGYNAYGQLGDSTHGHKNTPVLVGSVPNLQAVSAGDEHSLFFTQAGTTYAVGRNQHGQLGDGTMSDKHTPAPITVPSTPATAVGDPHLTNLRGEKFDLLQRGKHVLIQIPQNADREHTLLRVEANVTGGKSCEYAFIKSLNITGQWSKQTGLYGREYEATTLGHRGHANRKKTHVHYNVGPVRLLIGYGIMESGVNYLNFRANDLDKVSLPIGGLLGIDDHKEASSKDKCLQYPEYANMSHAEEVAAGDIAVGR